MCPHSNYFALIKKFTISSSSSSSFCPFLRLFVHSFLFLFWYVASFLLSFTKIENRKFSMWTKCGLFFSFAFSQTTPSIFFFLIYRFSICRCMTSAANSRAKNQWPVESKREKKKKKIRAIIKINTNDDGIIRTEAKKKVKTHCNTLAEQQQQKSKNK